MKWDVSFKRHVLLWTVIFSLCLPRANGSRIILVSLQLGSHIREQLVLGQELVSRGHDVYAVLGDRTPLEKLAGDMGIGVLRFHQPPHAKLHISKERDKEMGKAIYSPEGGAELDRLLAEASAMTLKDCQYMLEDKTLIQAIINLKVDLAIVDCILLAPCMALLPEYLGIPFVAMSSTSVHSWIRVPSLPSFVPDLLLGYTDEMSFPQRLVNTIAFTLMANIRMFSGLVDIPGLTDTTLVQKYAPKYRDLTHLYSRARLFITTTHSTLDWPVPSMPYIIQVPGITVTPAKPLDNSLKLLADQATQGIIAVSFGSSSASIPDEVFLKFLDTFRDLKQVVFWKFPNVKSHLEGLVPSNVIIMPWLPQNDLLGHPNTKLFITHCGNNGQFEAVYHGVPMLGLPLFAEQKHNAQRVVSRGLGLQMDILNFDSVTLRQNIIGLINNEEINKNCAKYKQIVRSRPMLPKEEAAYWVEHILEFGGDHLRSASLDMPFYKLYCLDMLCFLLLVLALTSVLVICLIRYVYRKCLKLKVD